MPKTVRYSLAGIVKDTKTNIIGVPVVFFEVPEFTWHMKIKIEGKEPWFNVDRVEIKKGRIPSALIQITKPCYTHGQRMRDLLITVRLPIAGDYVILDAMEVHMGKHSRRHGTLDVMTTLENKIKMYFRKYHIKSLRYRSLKEMPSKKAIELRGKHHWTHDLDV